MFKQNSDTNFVKAIAHRVAENEYQMELYRIEQSNKMKEIFTKEQLQQLEELVIEIRDYFKPEKK
jgi:hypothetical protein